MTCKHLHIQTINVPICSAMATTGTEMFCYTCLTVQTQCIKLHSSGICVSLVDKPAQVSSPLVWSCIRQTCVRAVQCQLYPCQCLSKLQSTKTAKYSTGTLGGGQERQTVDLHYAVMFTDAEICPSITMKL